jgi:hypothetical protein
MPVFYEIKRRVPSSDPKAYLDAKLLEVAGSLREVVPLQGDEHAIRDLARAVVQHAYSTATSEQADPIGYWWFRNGDFHWCEKSLTTVTIPDGDNPIEVVITIDRHFPFE